MQATCVKAISPSIDNNRYESFGPYAASSARVLAYEYVKYGNGNVNLKLWPITACSECGLLWSLVDMGRINYTLPHIRAVTMNGTP
ncbi:hypothetical protein M514_04167 [Trichuris suis]|uniref:Uncharacterized protein n=1 Tax=Trichuris suis TaxID=68888 RepID=A0A085MWK2_9BILA|nr:hypothetical protein M514_04167 [Trichuris suis]